MNWQMESITPTDLAHLFFLTGGGSTARCTLGFPPALTQTMCKRRLVERLSQTRKDRFLGFAPNSWVSPQNRSQFGPIYHYHLTSPALSFVRNFC
jgi:hypothetical protein